MELVRRYCSVAAALVLTLAAPLSAHDARAPRSKPNLPVLPQSLAPSLRSNLAQLQVSSALMYPVNPPRFFNGQRLATRTTNFTWMYPVNPPRRCPGYGPSR